MKSNSCIVLFLINSIRLSRANYVFNDTNIRKAVREWVANETLANSTYGHISTWNTSLVTDMSVLFAPGPNFPAETFNDDISGWDTSNVVNMAGMFDEALAFNQDIGKWNVGSVTKMFGMFARARAFNQNIGEWDLSSVEDVQSMFVSATNFTANSIQNWNTSSVTTMLYMFRGAVNVNGSFINSWDLSSVQDMAFMFEKTPSFTQQVCFASPLADTVNITGMFCSSNGEFAAACPTVSAGQRVESTRGCSIEQVTPSPSPTMTLIPSAATSSSLYGSACLVMRVYAIATSLFMVFTSMV